MEFCAVAKSGVHIYDATSFMPQDGDMGSEDWEENVKLAGDWKFDPSHSLPPSSGPAGFDWSADGKKLVTVDQSSGGPAVVWDAAAKYSRLCDIAPVGTSGGVRAVRFSPKAGFLVTHEKYDKEKCPQNVHVWDLRDLPETERLKSNQLRGYSSGKVPFDIYQWTSDDRMCLELAPGTGVRLLDQDLRSMDSVIPEPGVGQVSVSPTSAKEASACVYVPEAEGSAGYVAVYSLADLSAPRVKITLPTKLNGVTIRWNKDGSSVLALASSDVDPTGQSYFGTTSLFWIQADGKSHTQICGPEDGLVQDMAWSPQGTEFLVIMGMMPATISLYDGQSGKHTEKLGVSRRNTIRWNPFGRFFVVGGFGALPGDMDFFDNSSKETLCSFRANLAVDCSWAPDGRHFLTCTTCPRMNEDNQVFIYGYTGNQVVHIPFSPKKVSGVAGRQAADVGAMLYAAAWRPNTTFKDRPASPGRGPRRAKGLPSEGDDKSGPAATRAYVPSGAGGGGGSVAAMMRGEAPIDTGRWGGSGGSGGGGGGFGGGFGGDRGAPSAPEPQMTWEEIEAAKKQRQKEKKEELKAKEEAKNQALEDAKKRDKKAEGAERKLERLKKQLEGLDALKEKEWDELTEEDEAQLEGELDLRAEIQELENKIRTGVFT